MQDANICHPIEMDSLGIPPYHWGKEMTFETVPGCSVCGFPFRRDCIPKGKRLPVACPNCGAVVVD